MVSRTVNDVRGWFVSRKSLQTRQPFEGSCDCRNSSGFWKLFLLQLSVKDNVYVNRTGSTWVGAAVAPRARRPVMTVEWMRCILHWEIWGHVRKLSLI